MKNENSAKASFFAAFSVGAVLFSAHAGGGFATGNQAQHLLRLSRLGRRALRGARDASADADDAPGDGECTTRAASRTTSSSFETLYHPYDKLVWVFELFFYIMVLMAVAAAISGAASALTAYFGLNYYVGVVSVGALVLLLTIFGAGVVRAASTYMGLAILVTAITIYAVGIFKSDNSVLSVMLADFGEKGLADVPEAVFNAFVYAGFQCVTLPTMVACGTIMKNREDCARSMWISFVLNTAALVLSVLMLLSWKNVYEAIEGGSVIPTLTICGVMDISVLTVIYGVCLLLCLISTAVTTIFGFVARFESHPIFSGIKSAPLRGAIVSAFIIILSMSISMMGLTNIIKYGYGYCGYLGIAAVVVPFLTVGVYKQPPLVRGARRSEARRPRDNGGARARGEIVKTPERREIYKARRTSERSKI